MVNDLESMGELEGGQKIIHVEPHKHALVIPAKPVQRGEGILEDGVVIRRGDRGEKQDEPRINKGVKEQEGTRARYVESSNVSVGEGEWCKKNKRD